MTPVVELIASYPTPAQLKRAGQARIAAKLKAKPALLYKHWDKQITQAQTKQSVVVAGTDAAGAVLPHLARQLINLHTLRKDIAVQVEALVQAHPLFMGPTPMPGIGVRTAPILFAETLGKTFATSAHLASYAGLTPLTRRSRASIRGEHVSRTANKRLKRAMFLAAFAALRTNPASRAYYDRKREQGKRHHQALLALAHHRILTLHAMIRTGTLYDPQPSPKPARAV